MRFNTAEEWHDAREASLDYAWEMAIKAHNPPESLVKELQEHDANPDTLKPLETCDKLLKKGTLWFVEILDEPHRIITVPNWESIWEYDDSDRFELIAQILDFNI